MTRTAVTLSILLLFTLGTNALEISFMALYHKPSPVYWEYDEHALHEIKLKLNDKADAIVSVSVGTSRNIKVAARDLENRMFFISTMNRYVTWFEKAADSDGANRGSRILFIHPTDVKQDKNFGLMHRGEPLFIKTMTQDGNSLVGIALSEKAAYFYSIDLNADIQKKEGRMKVTSSVLKDNSFFKVDWSKASSIIATQKPQARLFQKPNSPKKLFMAIAPSATRLHIFQIDPTNLHLEKKYLKHANLGINSHRSMSTVTPTLLVSHQEKGLDYVVALGGSDAREVHLTHDNPLSDSLFKCPSRIASAAWNWHELGGDSRREIVAAGQRVWTISAVGRRQSELIVADVSTGRCLHAAWLEPGDGYYSSFAAVGASSGDIINIYLSN